MTDLALSEIELKIDRKSNHKFYQNPIKSCKDKEVWDIYMEMNMSAWLASILKFDFQDQ